MKHKKKPDALASGFGIELSRRCLQNPGLVPDVCAAILRASLGRRRHDHRVNDVNHAVGAFNIRLDDV